MKYLSRYFAIATAELLAESPANQHQQIIRNLSKVLAKKRLLKQLPKILATIEQKLITQKGGRIIDVVIAQKTRANENKIKTACRPTDLVNITENPHLLAGAKIIIDRQYVLDCSLAGRLQKIFT